MSTSLHYNRTARLLHWLMAVMILAMLFIGVGMVSSVSQRPWLLALHRPLGIAILLLVLVRLYNRLRHPPAPLPDSVPRAQRIAAHAMHWLLYGLMIAMPLLGWAMLSAGGYPIVLTDWWQLPAIVAPDPVLYTWLRGAHGWLGLLLFVLVLGHLAAALLHGLIKRDGVFSRMLRGRQRSA